ncbi:extracellular solute-binding protein [Paenibacillus koleovorans]|uniref:extracellular solute-binding protein n=1 Tax=Paenibacillus koleovorans TaxID=121608 RepID=UPI000FDBAA22|nr:extracellular solute-binding protein [Paenibacillus koleovorans]
MNKKLVVSALALLMTVSVVGCGGKEETPGSSASATPTPAPTEDKNAPKPNLKALLTYTANTDLNTYPVAKMLEEKTGYKVTYDMLPADKPEDKLNLIMASGEAYDYINTAGSSVFRSLFVEYARRGALVDLTPLIDKYGPNIKAAMSQGTLDALKVDNKIYAIPNPSISVVNNTLAIRQDWLDKLGLKMPTTTDEFVAVLKAFKEKAPGGAGTIPFSVNGSNADTMGINTVNLIGAFGMPNGWNESSGKLVPRPLDSNFKSYLSFAVTLYKDGLLDKEFAINKDANLKEKFTSGKVGVIPMNWAEVPTITDALVKNQPDAKIAFIQPLTGPGGKAGLGRSAGFDTLTYVPKSSKNQEAVVKWINAKLDKDIHKNLAIGEEGVHFTAKDGAYSPILPKFNDDRNWAGKYMSGYDEKLYPIYWQARVRKDARLFDAYTKMNNDIADKLKFPDLMGYIPPAQTVYSQNNQKLITMINDFMIKAIITDGGINGLDAFIQQYKTSGGDDSVKEVDGWYATYKK